MYAPLQLLPKCYASSIFVLLVIYRRLLWIERATCKLSGEVTHSFTHIHEHLATSVDIKKLICLSRIELNVRHLLQKRIFLLRHCNPNHNMIYVMSICRGRTLLDFGLRVSSVSSATLVLCRCLCCSVLVPLRILWVIVIQTII